MGTMHDIRKDDMYLNMSINQGYVPKTCFADGALVWGAVNAGKDLCGTCDNDRDICKGRKKYIDRESE